MDGKQRFPASCPCGHWSRGTMLSGVSYQYSLSESARTSFHWHPECEETPRLVRLELIEWANSVVSRKLQSILFINENEMDTKTTKIQT